MLNYSDSATTAVAIKDILTGNIEKPKKILEIFQQHNDQIIFMNDNRSALSIPKCAQDGFAFIPKFNL
jgi:hypothetical protein